MRCSVVVPTYNRAELLGLTLQSLVRQSLRPDEFEVIVVDDGSSDHTREKVASFASVLRVRYIFQEDKGYRVAKARNQGILAAQAPICVLVDSGILLAPECLESHCILHETSEHSLAVCGYVYGFNEDNEDAEKIRRVVDAEHPEKTMILLQERGEHLDLREEFYAKYGDNFDYLPAPWLVFWTCNVSAERDVLLEVGLFDENFCTWGGEDVELAYRLHRHGCHFVLSRGARSIHHPHEKSYEHNMQAARTSYLYFARKYKTPITALVPDNHFWVINDIIRRDNLPSCEEYVKQSAGVRNQVLTEEVTRMKIAESRLVLVFAPHPDDEAIAVGGTIARHKTNGDRVIIVFVTDGSESHAAVLGIHDDPVLAELARIRQSEAIEAAAKLCVPAQDVVQFHLQDTRVADDAGSLSAAIDGLLQRLPQVDTIYLPDPDRELNADHRVTGATVIECVRRLELEPSLLKYVVWDKDLEKAFEYQNRLNVPALVNDDEPLVVHDIESFHGDKMAALAEHKTQVTMFSKSQVRTVVPPWLIHKLQTQMSETFRIHSLRPQESHHGDVIVRSFEETGTR